MAQNKQPTPTVSPGQMLKDRLNISSSAKEWDNTTNSKYRIHNLMYPSDLMAPPNTGQSAPATDTGSYVMFYINVNEDSKLLKQEGVTVVEDFNQNERIRPELVANGGTAVGTAATTATIGAGVGSILGAGSGTSIGGGGLSGALLGGVAVGAVATQAASFSRAQKRLTAAIALHVPNLLNIRYGANWDTEDTELFSMVSEGGESLVNALGAMTRGASAADAIGGIKDKILNIAASGATTAIPTAVQGLTGLAPNPRKEQFFKGVDFRTFTFEYQFFPRDAAEAENVMNIIYLFKLHMHPEFKKDGGTFLYVYPSEFDIAYFHNHTENLHLHRHTSCVLTELNVNYTPNGQYTTFENGMPTQITMTLTFKELGLITKERVQQGL